MGHLLLPACTGTASSSDLFLFHCASLAGNRSILMPRIELPFDIWHGPSFPLRQRPQSLLPLLLKTRFPKQICQRITIIFLRCANSVSSCDWTSRIFSSCSLRSRRRLQHHIPGLFPSGQLYLCKA